MTFKNCVEGRIGTIIQEFRAQVVSAQPLAVLSWTHLATVVERYYENWKNSSYIKTMWVDLILNDVCNNGDDNK